MPDLSASVEVIAARGNARAAGRRRHRERADVRAGPRSGGARRPRRWRRSSLAARRGRLRRAEDAAAVPTSRPPRSRAAISSRSSKRAATSGRSGRSLVTAPFQAGELQILKLAANGSTVKKGDVVAEFDALTLRRTLQDKQSELRQAQAELDQATRAGEDRRRAGSHRRSIKAQYDVERAKLDLGDPQTRGARSEVERTQARARRRRAAAEGSARRRNARTRPSATADLGDAASGRSTRSRRTSIWPKRGLGVARRSRRRPTAPSASCRTTGTATAMGPAQEFRPGDRAWAGAQILELPDLSSVHLTSHIDESDRGQLKVGQTATMRVDAVPDRAYQATITDISVLARVDFSSGLAAGEELRSEAVDHRRRRAAAAGHERRRAHRRRHDSRHAARADRRGLSCRGPADRLPARGIAVSTKCRSRSCAAAASRSRSRRRSTPGDHVALVAPASRRPAGRSNDATPTDRRGRPCSWLLGARRRSPAAHARAPRAAAAAAADDPLVPTTRVTRGPLELERPRHRRAARVEVGDAHRAVGRRHAAHPAAARRPARRSRPATSSSSSIRPSSSTRSSRRKSELAEAEQEIVKRKADLEVQAAAGRGRRC